MLAVGRMLGREVGTLKDVLVDSLALECARRSEELSNVPHQDAFEDTVENTRTLGLRSLHRFLIPHDA